VGVGFSAAQAASNNKIRPALAVTKTFFIFMFGFLV
jgi:hypothetical protein